MGVGDFVFQGGAAGANQTASIVNAVVITGNTSGTTASVSSGTLVLNGGTNITLSQNGNTIQINGPSFVTQSFLRPNFAGQQSQLQIGQGSVVIWPLEVNGYYSFSRAHHLMTVSLSSQAGTSIAATLSIHVGIYTRTASTLNLLTSGSTNYQITDTAGASSGSLQGMRMLSIPINATLSPGDYWLGMLSITASAAQNWITMSNIQQSFQASMSGSFGGSSNTAQNLAVGMGHIAATSAAMPATVQINALVNNAQKDCVVPLVSFVNFTG